MLSILERTEILNRTRAMTDEELQYTLKAIPTPEILAEIARREGVILDKLDAVCQVWDELDVNIPLDQMDILEKEELIKRIRRAING